VFEYKEKDLSDFRVAIVDMRNTLDEKQPIERLFIHKIIFLLGQIDLIEGEDRRFTKLSEKLYGMPEKKGLDFAMKILATEVNRSTFFPEETVTPKEMAEIMRQRLKALRIPWRVELSNKIVSKINVSGRDRVIFVNAGLNYTPQEAERHKVHEIEVHVFRGMNGDHQPFSIFREGLAGHDEAEEALAILVEDILGCLELDLRQIKIYAGRYFAIHLALSNSFFDVFLRVREYMPDELAYRIVERVKRGLKDTSVHGAFTRELFYIRGIMRLEKFLENGGDLCSLYAGKVGFEDIKIVEKLLKDKILNPPSHMPAFLYAQDHRSICKHAGFMKMINDIY
jgi:uncharacterized protein (TIGR02421 family)